MGIITTLWQSRNLIGLGLAAVAALGVFIWIMSMRTTIADLRLENGHLGNALERQQQVNKDNLAELGKLKSDYQRQLAALTLDLTESQAQEKTITVIKEKIRHVPVPTPGAAVACPVGPRTLAALGELRNLAGRPAADQDPAAGSTADPRKPAGLQGEAGGANP